ncbi:MAG: hypothetical protein HY343_08780, partial [Lentisphaerae bacterium]|nr:hypothetical protein [Lentisphaerota bacterium]
MRRITLVAMTGRRLLATLTCLAALSAPIPDAGAAGPVLILFSNSSNGSLRSCYCPNSPWGGLAKRAWLLERLRSVAGDERVLLLDSGDLFPPDPEPDREDCVLRIYEAMRYDAVAVGDQELSAGYDAWLAVSTRLPWLSAGYTPAPSPTRTTQPFPAKPWIIVEKAGRRIGIVSVVGPDV